MNTLINDLRLVYPPFSNQEGDWFYKDVEVREYVKNSKLYMIVHRPELKFKDCIYKAIGHGYFEFRFVMENNESEIIRISAKEIVDEIGNERGSVILELGDKFIRTTNEDTGEVLSWYTVDKMIYDILHDKVELLKGSRDSIKEFWKFDLLYVGISKKHDSFSRLFKNAHHKRLKILTNESQKTKESRLTDEVMMLLFEIKSINIKTLDASMSVEDFLSNKIADDLKVLADAEKAFVHFLEAKYNEVMFSNYPECEDGLYDEKYERYSYAIAEDISLCTGKGIFNGAYGHSSIKDFIFVSKGESVLVKKEELATSK